MRYKKILGLLVLLAVVPACMDMDVENLNAPDADRALTEPGDVEALLGTAFYRWVNGVQKDASTPLSVAANEIASSWGNFGMQNAGTLPRGPYDNSPTASYTSPNRLPWNNIYQGLSNAADALFAVEFQNMTFTEDGADMTDRARAFGRFSQGVLTGWLAVFYDQAFIFDEQVLANLEEADPQLLPYPEVMGKAIEYLEESIQIAQAAPQFNLPGGSQAWIHGNPLSNQELIQWAHSFAAIYLASVARTPADRQAVDWNRVLFHLDRGLTVEAGTHGEQSSNIWWSRITERPDGWQRAAYDLVGPADTSGNYAAWLATDPLDRETFLIHTADRRITGPEGPTDRGTYVRIASPANLFPPDRGMYFQSAYFVHRNNVREGGTDFARMQPYFHPLWMGHWRAEAYLRLGQNRNEAIDLINDSRVGVGELPPLPYDASDEEVWQTLIYEKIIEQAVQPGGMVFFDRRGFGTLICGTPLHWPIHGSELELMQMPNYTFGGSGEGAADPATGCRSAQQSPLVRRP